MGFRPEVGWVEAGTVTERGGRGAGRRGHDGEGTRRCSLSVPLRVSVPASSAHFRCSSTVQSNLNEFSGLERD